MVQGRRLLRALLGASLVVTLLMAASAVTRADAPLSGNKPCGTVAPPAGATKFLLAGDSIVHESRGDWTWRYFLYKQLVAAGVNTDFVGDYNWLIDPNKSDWPYCDYQDPNFDTDFTASPGLKLSQYNVSNDNTNNKPWIRYEVETWNPDVLVMLAGANDLAQGGATAQQTLDTAKDIVTNARAANANLKIVLVATPTGGPYDNKQDAQYNTLLANQVAAWHDPGIKLVDVMHNWGTATYTWDQIHPNVVGEQIIANGIADKLSEMGIGSPGVGINPAYKIGLPQPITGAKATQAASAINLEWTLPVGASGVQIVARDTTDGVIGSWFQVIDYTWFPADIFGVGKCHESAPCTTYSITNLQAGHSYDIDLHAEKGFSIASDVWAVKQGESDAGGVASSTPGAWSFTIPGNVTLAKPAVATPTAGVHAVTVKWGAVAGANQAYKVRWRLAGTTKYGNTTSATTSRTISGLVAGAKYGFQVAAVRNGTIGPWSVEKIGTPKAGAIAAGAKPTLKALAGHKVKVTWKKTVGAGWYLLQYHLVGRAWKNVKFFTTTTYTSGKLAKKKSYEWRVVPYDGNVAGKASAAARITVK